MQARAIAEWARGVADSHDDVADRGTSDVAAALARVLPILEQTYAARAVLVAGSDPAVAAVPRGTLACQGDRTAAWRLPEPLGVLTLRWEDAVAHDEVELALGLIDAALCAALARRELVEVRTRNDHAQQLANMGDYDCHLASSSTVWSDHVYRMFGHEPGAFAPDYQRFIGALHPDDRERIQAIHQAAIATGSAFSTTERIVRPSGEIRHLASSGEVLLAADGTPERLRGTCIDVTEQVRADQDREHSAAGFRRLVESSPDAILLLERDTVIMANRRAHQLLGGDPLGRRLGAILADASTASGAKATALDGATLCLDVTRADLPGHQELTALYLRDAAPRLRTETVAASLREATVRRTQALELNDTVVQGLTAALMSMQSGDVAECEIYLQRTLQSARQMMNDWLEPLDGQDLRPGDLVRTTESVIAAHAPATATLEAPAPAPAAPVPAAPRIVIVDDNDDVRRLLRIQIERLKSYAVIGEACDGAEAIEVAAATQPDVVFLDMAMPRMDGLEALPHILEASPDSRVVVLSGFDESSMAPKAMAAGAVRYLEKGLRLNFREIIDAVMSAA